MTHNKHLRLAFDRAAQAMGWDTSPAYDPETQRSRVGAHFIQRAATQRPFWRVVKITSEGGGESVVHRHANSMTATELEAWLYGIAYAMESEQ